MSKNHIAKLSLRQKKLSAVFIGISFALAGIFLLCVSAKAIDIGAKRAVIPTLLCAFGLAFVSTSFVQDNDLWLWIGCCLLICGGATFMGEYMAGGFGRYFFVYFFAPAFASVITMLKNKDYLLNIKIAVLFAFAGVAALLAAWFDVAIVLSASLTAFSVAVILYGIFKEDKDHE